MVAAALLAGCGGGDGAAPAPGPRANRSGGDAAIARQAVIRLDAFPAGWAAQERPKGRSSCLGAVRRTAAATSASPAFRHGSQQVQSSAMVFRDADQAEHALRRLVSDATRRCYAEESTEAYRKGTGDTFQRVQAQALSVRGFGADGGGSRVRFSPSVEDPSTDVVIDLIAVRVGRAVGTELLIGSPRPLDAAVRARLARRHAALLESALREPPIIGV